MVKQLEFDFGCFDYDFGIIVSHEGIPQFSDEDVYVPCDEDEDEQ